MITAFQLAGFFAAHAIWSVSDGEVLIPMLAYTTEEGEQKMQRLVGDDLQAVVSQGKAQLDANEMDANDAVLLYDGLITLDNQKMDAIIIEVRTYFSPDSEATIAVPYSPKNSPASPFRVHKVKLLGWNNCEDFDMNAALTSFFEGIDAHEEGSRIWNESIDESK